MSHLMRPHRWLTAGIPSWLALIVGIMLGIVLTSTFTFRLWWCSYDDLSVDRETFSIIQVNEHFHAHKSPSLHMLPDESKDDCICGEEAMRLRRGISIEGGTLNSPELQQAFLDPVNQRPSDSLHTRPTEGTFEPLKTFNSSDHFSEYLNPNGSIMTPARSEVTYLSSEYTIKKTLLVAVVVTENEMDIASMIYDTWGSDVSQILFFVGEDCNISQPAATGIPIVRLPGFLDKDNNVVGRSFAVLKYLHDNYINNFHWFMRVGVHTFVRTKKLEKILTRLDPADMVYMGLGVMGREGEANTLKLQSHERYCLGSTGVVFSNRVLRELVPHLEYCLSATEFHNSEDENQWMFEDVEVGRCISRTLGIQCSQSMEARTYFVRDFAKEALSQKMLEARFSKVNFLTYFSVSSAQEMKLMYQFFRKDDLKDAVAEAQYIESQLNEMCHEAESPPTPGCEVSMCAYHHTSAPQKCPNAGFVAVAAKSYPFVGIKDYEAWEYFDSTTLCNDMFPMPSYWLRVKKDRRHELQVVLGRMVQVASEQHGRPLKFKRVLNGYVRHNPIRGNEYIIDAQFIDRRAGGKIVDTRVSLVKPLALNYLTMQEAPNKQALINFIVPIAKVNDRFKDFMQMYEVIGLKTGEKVNLLLSVYGESDVQFVNDVLAPYRANYPGAIMTVLKGLGTFSRSRALHLGMSSLKDEELAFLCDVDMDVGINFFDRCRRNAIRGKRVYYPEFFKLYNLEYVYHNMPKPSHIGIKRFNGHWAYYSYGMLCIYKSDYQAVGGMNTNIMGWGDEDINFFEKVLRKKLEVLRAPDPGLKHRWHTKVCPTSLSKNQYQHCLSSRAENLADRIELANYIYSKGIEIMVPKSYNLTDYENGEADYYDDDQA